MLLNIDKPLRTGTLHSNDCSFVPIPYDTEFKPRESLGRDGGWFEVTDESDARSILASQFPAGEYKRCQNC